MRHLHPRAGNTSVTTIQRSQSLPTLLALTALLAVGCSNGKAKEKESTETEANASVPVEIQPLRRAAMVAVHSGTASIEAHEEARLTAGDDLTLAPSRAHRQRQEKAP